MSSTKSASRTVEFRGDKDLTLVGDEWNRDAASAAQHPTILMLHGDADRTVPFVLGQRLFPLAPEPKRFIAMPGGSHSDLHVEHAAAYREAMGSVAQRLRSPR